MNSTVVIVSGGLDSVTLAYLLADRHPDEALIFVSFDYGQRHRRELDSAALAAERLDAEHIVIALPVLARLLEGASALTGGAEVPDGHYAEESMAATVVPNRNMVMLSIAGAIAVARRAHRLAIGVHGGDHFIYPDCRPDFIAAMRHALQLGTEGHAPVDFDLDAPFLVQTKADIVTIGAALGVPFEDTWSCYRGGAVHCGSCGTCYERREAFAIAGVVDPTTYLDKPTFADPR